MSWQEDLYTLLKAKGVTQFPYVPDAGHKVLIDKANADPDVRAIPLTTEEEGVGIVAGAHLGGAKAVLLLQSSGVGNIINFLSLIQHGRFPFLALVTMRGDYGEQNSWQYAMGQAVEPTLNAMGVLTMRIDREEDVVPTIDIVFGMVEKGGRAVAVLLTPRLLGVKQF